MRPPLVFGHGKVLRERRPRTQSQGVLERWPLFTRGQGHRARVRAAILAIRWLSMMERLGIKIV